MSNLSIGTSLAPYRPSIRPSPARAVEQGYGNQTSTAVPVATDVASLSIQTRVDLSQKAQVAPPPPPSESRRKPAQNPAPKHEARVATQDFAGRLCSGSLTGPLLMEDPLSHETDGCAFQTLDFSFESSADFLAVRGGSQALALLEPEELHSPASGQPIRQFRTADASFAYFGVQNGVAVLVQKMEAGATAAPEAPKSEVRLPDGQVVRILRSLDQQQEQLSLYLPAESLDNLADWGRSWLAIA